MQNALAMALPAGLQILPYGTAEDSDAFAVTRETAEKYGLKSLADLAKHNGKLVIGAAPEVKKRQVGAVGLKDVYGVEFKEFKSLDSSGPLVKGALKKGATSTWRTCSPPTRTSSPTTGSSSPTPEPRPRPARRPADRRPQGRLHGPQGAGPPRQRPDDRAPHRAQPPRRQRTRRTPGTSRTTTPCRHGLSKKK